MLGDLTMRKVVSCTCLALLAMVHGGCARHSQVRELERRVDSLEAREKQITPEHIRILSVIGEPAVIELSEIMRDTRRPFNVRLAAAGGLSNIDRRLRQPCDLALHALVRGVNECDDSTLKLNMITSVRSCVLGRQSQYATDSEEWRAAESILARPLADWLGDPDSGVRVMAACTLADLRTQIAAHALVVALDDTNASVRTYALVALDRSFGLGLGVSPDDWTKDLREPIEKAKRWWDSRSAG